LTREWAEGHRLSGRAHRGDDHAVGVELFQIETHDPTRCPPRDSDPIQVALGILKGQRADGDPRPVAGAPQDAQAGP
ncbi:MAG TPA: hypothetical protein VF590_19900, partial [Isosphaeraceae bacterium]